MKLKKINWDAIALNNEMMSNVIGGKKIDGIELGTTRFVYCNGGSEATFGEPSSDRVTETWTEDAMTGHGYWSPGGSYRYPDMHNGGTGSN